MKTLRFKIIAAVIAVFVVTANTAAAQAVRASYSVNTDAPFTVKYLGTDGDYLLFEVVVQLSGSKAISLGISDKEEGELYAENFPADLKVQKVKIERRPNQELNFKLEVGKSVYNKSFSVNTSHVANTVVSENDATDL